MPPTQIPTLVVAGPYPALPIQPLTLELSFTAADPVNGNFFVADKVTQLPSGVVGGDVLLVWNTAVTPVTFTLSSQPDAAGRVGDISSYTIAGTTIAAFKYSDLAGWADASGNIYISSPVVTTLFAVLQR